MKVLIIGGAGYIGSVLSSHLCEMGHDVTVLDLLLFGSQSLEALAGHPRFQLHTGDFRNDQTLARVIPGHDVVCLLGAIVGETACNRDPKTAEETNLHGALNVLRMSRQCGVPRFIFSSTCSNYGICDPSGLATEDSPLAPLSTYSRTKVAAETEILASANGDFCPTVLRFSTAFGVSPRMRFDLLVSDFTLAVHRERKIVIYGEQFWRPFVHIEDISQAIQLVMDAPREKICGQVYNVGSNAANVQKQQLGEMVRDEVEGTVLEFVSRNEDPRSYRVDFTKLASQLGFRARWSVEDGIREVHAELCRGRWENPDDRRFYN